MKLTYSTVHKAKDTEADYVIMLDSGPARAEEATGAKALERALWVNQTLELFGDVFDNQPACRYFGRISHRADGGRTQKHRAVCVRMSGLLPHRILRIVLPATGIPYNRGENC